MANRLPFPLWAVFVGFFGAVALAAGIVGLVGAAPVPAVAEPAVAWALIGVGALLILAETLVIALSIINRR
jgi:hypothetical protein